MVTGVSENTTLFSFLSGKYCISSVYLLDISHHPQTPQTWRRTAWAPPTMLRSHSWHQPPPSRWKMAMYITLFTMKEFSQSPTSMFQTARNRPEALIALHTQVQTHWKLRIIYLIANCTDNPVGFEPSHLTTVRLTGWAPTPSSPQCKPRTWRTFPLSQHSQIFS